MGKPGRQANFELLRIIAMFMVVILHWNTNSGLLLVSEACDGRRGLVPCDGISLHCRGQRLCADLADIFLFLLYLFPSGVWLGCWFRRCFIRC